VDITEFGLFLLLLYLNTRKARQISAEILYRFFVLKTYVKGLSETQIGAIKDFKADGLTYRQIAKRMTALKIPTKNGKVKWHPMMIKRIIDLM
jgi:hypothetical protein